MTNVGSTRAFYEKCRVVIRKPEDWFRPPYCALCRLPLIEIKQRIKYSTIELDFEAGDILLPNEAFEGLSRVIRAHGMGEVKGCYWTHGRQTLTVYRVPNVKADDLAYALFELAISYRTEGD